MQLDRKSTMSSPAEARIVNQWGPERRLEFIDFRLRWDGRINRSDLTGFFGISVPQASLDIAKYLELAPKNALYDRRSKVYLATETFQPLYPGNEPTRYLNEVLARATGVLPTELSFLGWTSPMAVAPNPTRTVPVDVLIPLLRAIREQRKTRVRYQSMSSNEPATRQIAPHALAYDGFRWHVRAFCDNKMKYLDFVIARVLDIETTMETGSDGYDDVAWHHQLELVLMPNPQLPESNRKVIALDYGMTNGEVKLQCRQALLFYALKRLGLLDVEGARPQDQQIALKNIDELRPYLPTSTAPR